MIWDTDYQNFKELDSISIIYENAQFDTMAKYIGWQEPNDPKVWVIAGEFCCLTCNRETQIALRSINEHTLQSHAVTSAEDQELFKEYIKRCKEELEDIQQDVPMNPDVALGLVVRE
jgi:hypothetical protein